MPDNMLRFMLLVNVTSSAFPSHNTVVTVKACRHLLSAQTCISLGPTYVINTRGIDQLCLDQRAFGAF